MQNGLIAQNITSKEDFRYFWHVFLESPFGCAKPLDICPASITYSAGCESSVNRAFVNDLVKVMEAGSKSITAKRSGTVVLGKENLQ